MTPARKPAPLAVPLSTLLAGWVDAASASTVTVGGLCNDSRRVRPGDLFLAVPGQRTSGTRHLDQAIAAGAVAALVDASLTPPAAASVPLFTVANLRALQGPVAARFYGEPSGALKVIGITGTNGKTSVSHFLAQCLPRCAILGTEGNGFPGKL